jgi:hypothetical protein
MTLKSMNRKKKIRPVTPKGMNQPWISPYSELFRPEYELIQGWFIPFGVTGKWQTPLTQWTGKNQNKQMSYVKQNIFELENFNWKMFFVRLLEYLKRWGSSGETYYLFFISQGFFLFPFRLQKLKFWIKNQKYQKMQIMSRKPTNNSSLKQIKSRNQFQKNETVVVKKQKLRVR